MCIITKIVIAAAAAVCVCASGGARFHAAKKNKN